MTIHLLDIPIELLSIILNHFDFIEQTIILRKICKTFQFVYFNNLQQLLNYSKTITFLIDSYLFLQSCNDNGIIITIKSLQKYMNFINFYENEKLKIKPCDLFQNYLQYFTKINCCFQMNKLYNLSNNNLNNNLSHYNNILENCKIYENIKELQIPLPYLSFLEGNLLEKQYIYFDRSILDFNFICKDNFENINFENKKLFVINLSIEGITSFLIEIYLNNLQIGFLESLQKFKSPLILQKDKQFTIRLIFNKLDINCIIFCKDISEKKFKRIFSKKFLYNESTEGKDENNYIAAKFFKKENIIDKIRNSLKRILIHYDFCKEFNNFYFQNCIYHFNTKSIKEPPLQNLLNSLQFNNEINLEIKKRKIDTTCDNNEINNMTSDNMICEKREPITLTKSLQFEFIDFKCNAFMRNDTQSITLSLEIYPNHLWTFIYKYIYNDGLLERKFFKNERIYCKNGTWKIKKFKLLNNLNNDLNNIEEFIFEFYCSEDNDTFDGELKFLSKNNIELCFHSHLIIEKNLFYKMN
ncbi:hypothetical protein ABK040_014888 [Willaertia magna]